MSYYSSSFSLCSQPVKNKTFQIPSSVPFPISEHSLLLLTINKNARKNYHGTTMEQVH